MVRVRFAPSPTGYLHIGGARTALFNWLYARSKGGKFILRIEDTDVKRSTPAAVEAILEGLRWLGLDWDEGPYFQSERLEIYQRYARQLLESGSAYYCYCTPQELEEKRAKMVSAGQEAGYDGTCRELSQDKEKRLRESGRKPSVRFKVPPGLTKMADILRGPREFDNQLLGDFIILRPDRTPTYNFAVVVDDGEMGITHVIRGDDHISNTPRQILLFEALKFNLPSFAHLPMIWGSDRTRLSKRHGATSVTAYREEGYLPEALVNYLALLGWSTSDSQQIIGREELISKFSLERISKNPAIFDQEKLTWMNGEYLRSTDLERLLDLAMPYLKEMKGPAAGADRGWFKELVRLYQERIKTLSQLLEQADFFFTEEIQPDEEALNKVLRKEGVVDILRRAGDVLAEVEPFKVETIEHELRALAAELGVGAGKVIHPLRVSLTGRRASPGLFEVITLLGRPTTLRRIEQTINDLKKKT